MKFLKFLVIFFSIFGTFVFLYGFLNEYGIIDTLINYYKKSPSVLINNEYEKDFNINFAKKTNDFEANNKQEVIDIYFTVISSGMDEFTFYCANNYPECINDVILVNDDSSLLSQMNNFINVFNTFRSIKTTYTSTGKVTLSINKVYKKLDIEKINDKVDEIYNNIIIESKSDRENIKVIHDYIVNNTKYNVAEENIKEFTPSSNATGVLFNKLATCNGYTDTMSIFLDKLGVENVRISNDTHIWNLVYLDNEWLHIDATWDDPVNNLDKDLLEYDYYLLTTERLKFFDEVHKTTDHEFDSSIYNFVI